MLPNRELIQTMNALLQLHDSLWSVTEKKTEILQKGDTEALQQLLKEEDKHVRAIEKVERKRQQLVRDLVPEHGTSSFDDCLAYVSIADKEKMLAIREQLAGKLLQIKERNVLNQELLNQSLHFVHLSMNMLRPKEEATTYGPQKGKKPQQQNGQGFFQAKV